MRQHSGAGLPRNHSYGHALLRKSSDMDKAGSFGSSPSKMPSSFLASPSSHHHSLSLPAKIDLNWVDALSMTSPKAGYSSGKAPASGSSSCNGSGGGGGGGGASSRRPAASKTLRFASSDGGPLVV